MKILKDNNGSAAIIAVAVITVLVVAGLAALAFNNARLDSGDEDTGSGEAAEAEIVQEERESFTVNSYNDLGQTCTGGEPSGLTGSGTGNVVISFVQSATITQDSYRWEPGTARGTSKLTDFDILADDLNPKEVDYIACYDLTDTIINEVTCEFESTTATMVRKEYKLNLFSVSDNEVVATVNSVNPSSSCPFFVMAGEDNKFNASLGSDGANDALAEAANSIM